MSEVLDIDLSRNEDSVMSLAIAQSTDSYAVAFAGINSSSAEQNAGKNEHLRSFALQYPPRRRLGAEGAEKDVSSGDAGTRALGRSSLFTPSSSIKKEAYQRVLRLSPSDQIDQGRIGAVATGLEPKGEIVVFDASKETPTNKDVQRRIRLGDGQEAADVDIVRDAGDNYVLAYCTDYEVCITKVVAGSGATQADPTPVYEEPYPDTFASTTARPKLRSLRFLQPNLLLLLQNKASRGGAELVLLELPSSQALGTVILRKSLHRAIKAATALTVCRLPGSILSENSQSAIAVAGQDNSITTLTLDHPQQKPIPSLKFRSHALLRDVHTNLITSLTFSNFRPPPDPSKAAPQYLKLASTSIASTVVVHTFPLLPYPQPERNRTPSRYVLTPPGRSEATQMTLSVLISALVIAIGAFLLQAFTELRGGSPEYLGVKGWLSESVHGWIAKPYMFDDAVQSNVPGRAIPSQAAKAVENAKQHAESNKIPGIDALNVPGVEANPIEGVKSVAAEVAGTANEKMKDAKEAVQDGSETVSDGMKEATAEVWKGAESAQKKLGLRHLLSRRSSSKSTDTALSDDSPSDIIVQHDENSESLSADVRDADTVIGDAHKKWEDLEAHERETWKRRLVEAGEWAADEGEAVLKGVFFQNIALAVGAAAGHVMG